ncbi:MAG: putative iron-regulated membrane protein [Pseudohongiellaceae bacterium]
MTDTGAEVTVDWNRLLLSQRGRDTYWINQVYDIHYLRWTGISWMDKILGVAGLLLLILMTVTGIRLLFKSPVH